MGTTFTTGGGRLNYFAKFLVIFALAIVLLIANMITNNDYLQWGAALTFVIAMPYFILSVIQFIDRLSQ